LSESFSGIRPFTEVTAAEPVDQHVVERQNIITGRDPQAAEAFARAVIDRLSKKR